MTGSGDLFDNYRALVAKVDALCRNIEKRSSGQIACRPGCDSCCRHLALFPVEAVFLRASLGSVEDRNLVIGISERATAASHDECPLLDTGECLLYRSRPVICRTHGMPILVEREDRMEVDHCPLNFTDRSVIQRDMIISLEQLNTMLAAVNQVFVDQAFEDRAFPERIRVADALLMDLEFLL